MTSTERTAEEIFDEGSDHTYEPTKAEIDEAIAQSLAEIKSEGLDFCRTFEELHDHIDANELGGFCENRFHWTIEAMRSVQDAVHENLKNRA